MDEKAAALRALTRIELNDYCPGLSLTAEHDYATVRRYINNH